MYELGFLDGIGSRKIATDNIAKLEGFILVRLELATMFSLKTLRVKNASQCLAQLCS